MGIPERTVERRVDDVFATATLLSRYFTSASSSASSHNCTSTLGATDDRGPNASTDHCDANRPYPRISSPSLLLHSLSWFETPVSILSEKRQWCFEPPVTYQYSARGVRKTPLALHWCEGGTNGIDSLLQGFFSRTLWRARPYALSPTPFAPLR